MSWTDLSEVYSATGIVPVLGAGLSVGSNLPDWSELLRRVARRCGHDVSSQLVDDLVRAGYGLPAVAGMLRAMCTSRAEFTNFVREELYRDFRRAFAGAPVPPPDHLVTFVRSHNRTLSSVAALCAVESHDGRTFHRNRKVKAIVNFNVDAVFREYVQARYRRALVRTIERPSKEPDRDRVSVYYMHGFLRFDEKADDPTKEASDKLVLAEHEYFDFFNNPTGLFNHTFLYLMREHRCVFIGLSMHDYNIRRLLHYSTKERVQAYVDEGKSVAVGKSKSLRHFAILKRHESDSVNIAVERSLEELGTRVLWITSFAEIPEQLGKMYESGGNSWSAVYS